MTAVYLDAGVAVPLVPILRAAGHNAVTADDEGLKYARDNVQMVAAWRRGRVLGGRHRVAARSIARPRT